MGRIMRLIALLIVMLAAAPGASAEYSPPPTFEQMLAADCIVVGQFEQGPGGSLDFKPGAVLHGKADAVAGLARAARESLRREEGMELWSRAMATRLLNRSVVVDAKARWIWFLSADQEPEVQPVEFVDGYRALLRKAQPGLFFRLLQGLDLEMGWAAMEELVAQPDRAIVDRLHVLGKSPRRSLSYAARRVLAETRLLDRARLPDAREWEGPYDPPRVPLDSVPAWTEDQEVRYLVDRLTSHSQHEFIMASAGREIAQHYFAAGFAELTKRLGQHNVFNTDMVMDGLGYVRHPDVFAFLVEHMAKVPVVHRTFHAGLTALGRQDTKTSFDAVQTVVKKHMRHGPGAFGRKALIASYGLMSDPRAQVALRELGGAPPTRTLAALKAEVVKRWPQQSRERWDDERGLGSAMQNFSGAVPRRGAIAEVARQDPAWLAALALEKMASPRRAARQAGEGVFQGLTGRTFGYRAEAFLAERREPLAKLRAWWTLHKDESRERWLLAYFREQGFEMDALRTRASLPVLSRALESDFVTHCLAVEQISVIAGKFFSWLPTSRSHMGMERMTVRVRAWLTWRGYLK